MDCSQKVIAFSEVGKNLIFHDVKECADFFQMTEKNLYILLRSGKRHKKSGCCFDYLFENKLEIYE